MIKKVWEKIAYWWVTAVVVTCAVGLTSLLFIVLYQGVVNDFRTKKSALEIQREMLAIQRETLTLEIYATMQRYELDCTDYARLLASMIEACQDDQFFKAVQ